MLVCRDSQKGFTLLELVIVVMVIGILTTLGISQYFPVKERALGKEAISNLKLIAAAERIYRMETGGYYPSPGATESNVANINDALKLLLTEANWDYSITTTGNPASTFTVTAARNGTGGYLNCQYTLTHNDADGEPNPTSCP